MDGETIRLVATATGAVIAGLGGAGIAGWFNRSNTMATIAAAELQATRNREQEHAQWLRDRKVKSYAAFLSQVRDLELALSNLYGAEPMDPRRLREIRTDFVNDELLIIAPRHIYDASITVMKKVTAIVRATEINGDSLARKTAYDAALLDFIDNFTTLERLIRQDLGVEALAQDVVSVHE